jgi:uncharacterized protein (DUF4415 family)
MNDDISGCTSTTEPASDWERVRRMSDTAVHNAVASDTDVLPTDAAFSEGARVVMPRPKETVTIRLDADLLAWLRRERGYQTRVNAVLRAHMEAETRVGGESLGRVGRKGGMLANLCYSIPMDRDAAIAVLRAHETELKRLGAAALFVRIDGARGSAGRFRH